MKGFSFFICLLFSGYLIAQTKDVNLAKDFFNAFLKEGKLSDLEKSYDLIQKAMVDEKNKSYDESNFYQGVITKQYYVSKNLSDKSDFIINASKSFLKTYSLNKNFAKKEQLLKLMQVMGYDLYADGIKLFKQNNNEKAYESYKLLIQIQDVLAENNMNFTIKSTSGETSNIANQDIMNNLVVFCMNMGKKEEAKSIFEKELKSKPTALTYARLIQLCFQINDTSAANHYITEAIGKFPQDEDILIFAINQNLEKGKITESLKYLNAAIQSFPTPKLYLVKAQVLEGNKEYDKSITTYKDALKLYPNDFDLNYSMGYALFNESLRALNQQSEIIKPNAIAKLKESKDFFLKAQSINPTKVDFEKILSQVDSIK